MKILGLQKTTLLDFPGQVACTIFTGGCNFRCPFCHNSELFVPGEETPEEYTEEEIFSFLKKRKGVLTGVAITGGEPTLQPDLMDFIRKVRDLGYLIKLDTNGYKPEVTEEIIKEKLADYIAMDIKSCRENYAKVAGTDSIDLSRIERSVNLLMERRVPYEFRTTVVKKLHSKDDFVKIAEWLDGADAYFLQSFTDTGHVLKSGFSAYTQAEMAEFLPVLRKHIRSVHLRGIDYDEDKTVTESEA
jgi:pyruvate formate lyase activating enzyme